MGGVLLLLLLLLLWLRLVVKGWQRMGGHVHHRAGIVEMLRWRQRSSVRPRLLRGGHGILIRLTRV